MNKSKNRNGSDLGWRHISDDVSTPTTKIGTKF